MLRLLHLVGSCEDEHLYHASFLYANKCESHGEYDFFYAVVSPDKKWCFTKDLEHMELDEKNNPKMSLSGALRHIEENIKPDVVLHHIYDQTGSTALRVMVELLGIPLIGSPSETVTITKNKATTKNILAGNGVVMPKGFTVTLPLFQSNPTEYGGERIKKEIGLPCVVKAASVEDSLGVFIVHQEEDVLDALEKAFQLCNVVLVEEFIVGREVRCGVLEKEDGVLEVLPILEYHIEKDSIRHYGMKYEYDGNGNLLKGTQTLSSFVEPSKSFNDELIKSVSHNALLAYRILNLRDFGLFDFRVDKDGQAYMLEVNLFASFGSASFVNILARKAGYTDKELLKLVVNRAVGK